MKEYNEIKKLQKEVDELEDKLFWKEWHLKESQNRFDNPDALFYNTRKKEPSQYLKDKQHRLSSLSTRASIVLSELVNGCYYNEPHPNKAINRIIGTYKTYIDLIVKYYEVKDSEVTALKRIIKDQDEDILLLRKDNRINANLSRRLDAFEENLSIISKHLTGEEE